MSMSASLIETTETTKTTEATFLEPTYKRALIIWWAIFWRTMLWSVPAGVLVAFVEASLINVDKLDSTWCFGTGTIVSMLVGIFIIRSVLRKKHRGFSIRLVAS